MCMLHIMVGGEQGHSSTNQNTSTAPLAHNVLRKQVGELSVLEGTDSSSNSFAMSLKPPAPATSADGKLTP